MGLLLRWQTASCAVSPPKPRSRRYSRRGRIPGDQNRALSAVTLWSRPKSSPFCDNLVALIEPQRSWTDQGTGSLRVIVSRFGEVAAKASLSIVSSSGGVLRRAPMSGEKQAGAKQALKIIHTCKPKIICFIGKIAFNTFYGGRKCEWVGTRESTARDLFDALSLRGPAGIRIRELREVKEASEFHKAAILDKMEARASPKSHALIFTWRKEVRVRLIAHRLAMTRTIVDNISQDRAASVASYRAAFRTHGKFLLAISRRARSSSFNANVLEGGDMRAAGRCREKGSARLSPLATRRQLVPGVWEYSDSR